MSPTRAEVEQITVFLENRPGILADLCAHLSDHRIDLRAIAVLDSTDIGAVRMVVDQPELAKKTLADAGVEFSSGRCLAMEIPNNPGGFAGIAHKLTLAGINIDYIYASAPRDTLKTLGIFHVSDVARALSLDWDS